MPEHDTSRICGTCTLCCKVMEVSELSKPAQQWCPHADPRRGCMIYETRPQSCRDFMCQWLLHPSMPASWMPSYIHAVLHVNAKDELLVIPDRMYAGIHEPRLNAVINQLVKIAPVTITERM